MNMTCFIFVSFLFHDTLFTLGTIHKTVQKYPVNERCWVQSRNNNFYAHADKR